MDEDVVGAGPALRAAVRADFDLDLVVLEPVMHGADDAAELWGGVCADGASYAVKTSRGGTAAGLVVSAYLAGQGVPGVAAPVPSGDGRLWSERAGGRLSVVPWLSGERALGRAMTREHWVALGALLAAVHRTPVVPALADLLPGEDHDPSRFTALARSIDRRVRDWSGDDDLATAAVQLWLGVAERVWRVVDRTEALGGALRRREATRVVCHADPHLGNVLVGDDGEVWLVDWDDAVLAPRECDLMFVMRGVLVPDLPVPAEQEAWFVAGYGPVDVDPARLAYQRSTRALTDVADWAARVLDVGARPEAERAEALSIVSAVAGPGGLLELAEGSLSDLRT